MQTTFKYLLVAGSMFITTTWLSAQNFNLKINEIIASNINGETDGFDVGEDWVEIYNPPGNPITNMAGYYLSDDPDSLDKWLIPSTNAGTTTILPNNHLVFWIDKDANQGEDHVDFSLSEDGETFLLVAPDGTTIIDSISYPQMVPDISYGRITDGNSGWMFFNNVTFENPNAELDMLPEILFINEVQVNNNSTFDDNFGDYDAWFEVYNPNAFQVNLAGYHISNTADPLQYQIPNSNPYYTVIPPGGFRLIWCDGELSEESNHAPLTLGAT
ncbi:MAG: lamin tail domain-containing protein, partial [Flavobacteriales bacterium]|nr:lamin tail domain-containing protein [Flavobacteriales bacterium]